MLIDKQTAIQRLNCGRWVYAYGVNRGVFRVKAISDNTFTTSMGNVYPLLEVNSFSTVA